MSRQSIVPPSKKVQSNSRKLIEKVHHVNHTFSINGWATFKMYLRARVFWVGLLTDMTHTNEYPKVELGGNSYIYKR
jgi:hypothetical protein